VKRTPTVAGAESRQAQVFPAQFGSKAQHTAMTAALLHDSLGEPVRVRVGSCGGAGSYESSQAAVPEFGGHSSFCQTMLATDKIFQCCPGNLKLQGSVVDVAVTAVPCAMDVGSVPSTETSSWAGASSAVTACAILVQLAKLSTRSVPQSPYYV